MNKQIKNKLESILGENVRILSGVGGGSIADSNIIETSSGKRFFLKTGFSNTMFLNEANGLKELGKPGCIKVPEVIAADRDFLLLELIVPSAQIKNFWTVFGQQFAALHRFSSSSFGFYEDNYIGATPQKNIPSDEERNNWTVFYLNKRLRFQIQLAEHNGYGTAELRQAFSVIESKIDAILSGSEEPPALLHGDLWSGNFITGTKGEPVLIDPAVYYGHREADLAMTYLFGGFSNEFYRAYNEAYPLKDGWEYRLNIYKLYHVLNHLNLFGTGYYGQAIRLMEYYR
ncbi:MAG: fructosamine kinase family protein [Chlorobi bacterium]|nr:fructosamine kinase family protein [Chlorobiota bacterium]